MFYSLQTPAQSHQFFGPSDIKVQVFLEAALFALVILVPFFLSSVVLSSSI